MQYEAARCARQVWTPGLGPHPKLILDPPTGYPTFDGPEMGRRSGSLGPHSRSAYAGMTWAVELGLEVTCRRDEPSPRTPNVNTAVPINDGHDSSVTKPL